jgi:hypothetical protein
MLLSFFRVARRCCVLAALVLASTPASAQARGDRIPVAELTRAQGTNLYEAVAELRPEWMSLGGDAADPASRDRVLVFIDGRHVGDLSALWTIETRSVAAIQLRSPEYVRRTYPRYPRTEFNAAIYVATRAAPEDLPQGRFTVSLDGGIAVRSRLSNLGDALADAGYDKDFKELDNGIVEFTRKGTAQPLVLGGTVAYRAVGPWGVALAGVHTLEGFAAGYNPDTDLALTATMTATEGALLVTRDLNRLRIGVGPALRVVDWTWASGFCQCVDEQGSSDSVIGVALEGAFLVRMPRVPVMPQVRALARYYPSQSTQYAPLGEPLEVGGLVVSLGIGLATVF